MNVLHQILRLIEVLLICGVVLIASFVALIIFAMRLPEGNPLRVMLTHLAWRVGATGATMIIDPVVTEIPSIGELFDLVTLGFLIYYWYTFFREAFRTKRQPPT